MKSKPENGTETNKPEIRKFTLTRKEVPVEIDGQLYTLLEMDGKQRDQYLNHVGGKMKTTSEGKPAGLKDFNNLQSRLISQHLKDLEGEYVKEDVINTYPASVVSGLAEMCREISGLDDEGEEEAKND